MSVNDGGSALDAIQNILSVNEKQDTEVDSLEPGDRGMQYDPPELRGPRERNLTDKGKSYQLERHSARRKELKVKLQKQVKKIYDLFESLPGSQTLEKERDSLDFIKEDFNEAHRAYNELLEADDEKDVMYRDFDLCDREYTELVHGPRPPK